MFKKILSSVCCLTILLGAVSLDNIGYAASDSVQQEASYNELRIAGYGEEQNIWHPIAIPEWQQVIDEQVDNQKASGGVTRFVIDNNAADGTANLGATLEGTEGVDRGNVKYAAKLDGLEMSFTMDRTKVDDLSEHIIFFSNKPGWYNNSDISMGIGFTKTGDGSSAAIKLHYYNKSWGEHFTDSEYCNIPSFCWDGSIENTVKMKMENNRLVVYVNDTLIAGGLTTEIGQWMVNEQPKFALGRGYLSLWVNDSRLNSSKSGNIFDMKLTSLREKNVSPAEGVVYKEIFAENWSPMEALGTTAVIADKGTNGVTFSDSQGSHIAATLAGEGTAMLMDGLQTRFKVNLRKLGSQAEMKTLRLLWSDTAGWYLSESENKCAFGLEFISTGGGNYTSVAVLRKGLTDSDLVWSSYFDGIPFCWDGTRENILKINIVDNKLEINVNGIIIGNQGEKDLETPLRLALTRTIAQFPEGKGYMGIWLTDNTNMNADVELESVVETKREFVKPELDPNDLEPGACCVDVEQFHYQDEKILTLKGTFPENTGEALLLNGELLINGMKYHVLYNYNGKNLTIALNGTDAAAQAVLDTGVNTITVPKGTLLKGADGKIVLFTEKAFTIYTQKLEGHWMAWTAEHVYEDAVSGTHVEYHNLAEAPYQFTNKPDDVHQGVMVVEGHPELTLGCDESKTQVEGTTVGDYMVQRTEGYEKFRYVVALYRPADVHQDNSLTVQDLVAVKKAVKAAPEVNGYSVMKAADVDANGTVSEEDAAALRETLVK